VADDEARSRNATETICGELMTMIAHAVVPGLKILSQLPGLEPGLTRPENPFIANRPYKPDAPKGKQYATIQTAKHCRSQRIYGRDDFGLDRC
jgi:hypothetical protein